MNKHEAKRGVWGWIQESLRKASQTVADTKAVNLKLDEMGLSNDKIAAQNPTQLIEMLKTIDNLIDKGVTPEPLGNVEFSLFKTIALSKKQLIMSRISLLTQEETIDKLEGLAKKLPEKDGRAELEKAIEEMRQELQVSQAKLKQNADQLRELEDERQSGQAELTRLEKQAEIELAKTEKNAEINERRYRIIKSFLERESVATIIGALLLFILTIVLVVAAFRHTALPEIINNAFLLILGYFFGRETNRANNFKENADRETNRADNSKEMAL